ncbi:hypothetical protein J6590_050436 [Homalodisca vitripennis]|nr:hypothetical protein J6590_050436 [Homalodisca vitripennis]
MASNYILLQCSIRFHKNKPNFDREAKRLLVQQPHYSIRDLVECSSQAVSNISMCEKPNERIKENSRYKTRSTVLINMATVTERIWLCFISKHILDVVFSSSIAENIENVCGGSECSMLYSCSTLDVKVAAYNSDRILVSIYGSLPPHQYAFESHYGANELTM